MFCCVRHLVPDVSWSDELHVRISGWKWWRSVMSLSPTVPMFYRKHCSAPKPFVSPLRSENASPHLISYPANIIPALFITSVLHDSKLTLRLQIEREALGRSFRVPLVFPPSSSVTICINMQTWEPSQGNDGASFRISHWFGHELSFWSVTVINSVFSMTDVWTDWDEQKMDRKADG